ncbi:MAG: VTT domain-containing protein [Candidatus Omnitrophica bacterium]|nr:VTT domain-containing protein [Candidatus Omnitrophota bacterium]
MKYKELIKFFIFIFLIFSLAMMGRYLRLDQGAIKSYLQKYPFILSGIIFVFLYVVITFFIWLSKDIFRFISAVLFGANLSTLLVFIAEVINAFILFHLSRYMGKEFVEKRIFKDRFSYYKERLERRTAFFSLFLLRATPMVPFRFLDIFMGLSPISFKKYLLAVLLGSPLRIYWLQFILVGLGISIFKEPSQIIYYLATHKIIFIISLVYVILIIILGFILFPKRR